MDLFAGAYIDKENVTCLVCGLGQFWGSNTSAAVNLMVPLKLAIVNDGLNVIFANPLFKLIISISVVANAFADPVSTTIVISTF